MRMTTGNRFPVEEGRRFTYSTPRRKTGRLHGTERRKKGRGITTCGHVGKENKTQQKGKIPVSSHCCLHLKKGGGKSGDRHVPLEKLESGKRSRRRRWMGGKMFFQRKGGGDEV